MYLSFEHFYIVYLYIYFVVALSSEFHTHLAVSLPLTFSLSPNCRQHTILKLSRAIKFIFAIWVTAMHFSVVFELDGISCTVNSYKVEVYLLLPLSFFHIVLLVRLLVFICVFFDHVFVVSDFILTAICAFTSWLVWRWSGVAFNKAVLRHCLDFHRFCSVEYLILLLNWVVSGAKANHGMVYQRVTHRISLLMIWLNNS